MENAELALGSAGEGACAYTSFGTHAFLHEFYERAVMDVVALAFQDSDA